MEYVIEINENDENLLKQYGNITYKSKVLKGLYFIESNYKLEFLKSLDFIVKIYESRLGYFV